MASFVQSFTRSSVSLAFSRRHFARRFRFPHEMFETLRVEPTENPCNFNQSFVTSRNSCLYVTNSCHLLFSTASRFVSCLPRRSKSRQIIRHRREVQQRNFVHHVAVNLQLAVFLQSVISKRYCTVTETPLAYVSHSQHISNAQP